MGDAWTMLEGDFRDTLRDLPDESIDHVITDPPYEASAHTKQRRLRSRSDARAWKRGSKKAVALDNVPIDFGAMDHVTRHAAAAHFARLTRRWCLVFCQAEGLPLWRSKCERYGLRHIRCGFWIKPDGQPQYGGDRPGSGYEAIAILHSQARTAWNGGGSHAVWTHCTRWRAENEGQSYRRGGREGQDDHMTTKPLALMMELVEQFTNPGDLILDPFAGSGTTGIAALRLGRRFLGCERDPKSYALACERLTAESQGTTLRAARAGQMAFFGKAK